MQMNKSDYLKTINILQDEVIRCLYSVLAEWDQDKSCFIQWERASSLDRAIDLLNFKLSQLDKGNKTFPPKKCKCAAID